MGSAKPGYLRNFLTPADAFYEITRGRPYELDAEGRRVAGLTPETWSLEIVPDERIEAASGEPPRVSRSARPEAVPGETR